MITDRTLIAALHAQAALDDRVHLAEQLAREVEW